MRIQTAAMALLGAVAGWCWQDSLASLRLTRETFERQVTDYVRNAVHDTGEMRYAPGLGRAGAQALLAMDDAARAAVAKELGAAAKALVMSPQFAAAYETYLKTSQNAVNHGIVVKDAQAETLAAAKSNNMAAFEAATNNMMRDMYRKSVIERLPSTAKMDRQTLEIMAESDAGMLDASAPSTAADKANVAKAKAMLSEAKKLAASDIDKARATYRAALMLGAGLGDERQLAAEADAAKKKEQQLNYNRLALKPALKRRLQAFVTVARSVDFKAATQAGAGGKRVFVNKAYENKSGFWKMLYRLGPGGTNAAAAVAQSWIAEL